jgi:hypothetical protein
MTPEEASALLAGDAAPPAPSNSWLRLRGMESPAAVTAPRRSALAKLRLKGYHLVALLTWPDGTWASGVRLDNPIRRTPYDLREAFGRCRALASAYGDLVDYWEIGNEPDISYLEENPETYASYLKACYLGIRASAPGPEPFSGVLMAPLALPPGPYLEAFLRNRGLQYTDGFNYHYYGYAEDFTGVYRQFRDAVEGGAPDSGGTNPHFETEFYPDGAGMAAKETDVFGRGSGPSAESLATLLSRHLASEEPELGQDGRWLTTPGVEVTEADDLWRFNVSGPAPGPLRPAMAELPLPSGWKPSMDDLLSLEFRIRPSPGAEPRSVRRPRPDSYLPKATAEAAIPAPRPGMRKLPVFLTEYGYGLLSAQARNSAEGRERQRAWFESVSAQAGRAGIEAGMAFLLRPYVERETDEFGLLTDTPLGRSHAGKDRRFLPDYPSPALSALLDSGRRPMKVQRWDTSEPKAATTVVLDFVSGPGLLRAKSYSGYFVQERAGTRPGGRIVVYNFSDSAASGELRLSGTSWLFQDGSAALSLNLGPNDRREVAVNVTVAANGFSPQRSIATFHSGSNERPAAPIIAAPPLSPIRQAEKPAPAVIPTLQSEPMQAEFEVYIRTSNGNLYQTWPRLVATANWKPYTERLGNFTMAFFGRAEMPWRFSENKPVALEFFFRPAKYPLSFEIRRPRIVSLGSN